MGELKRIMTAPQTATVPTVAAYPLDQDRFTIHIQANGKTLTHVLRRPTLNELSERDQQSVYETEEVSADQDTITLDDERANANLWNKIAVSVGGYKTQGHRADETITVTPDIAEKIPSAHKATAIRGMYSFTAVIEASEDDGFDLDGENFVVAQTMGDADAPVYVIRHTLRQPTEGERQDYKKKASRTLYSRGTKRTRARIVTNLKASVELYDKLFVEVGGVEYTGAQPVQTMIDPAWKRQVVSTLMSSFESSLSD